MKTFFFQGIEYDGKLVIIWKWNEQPGVPCVKKGDELITFPKCASNGRSRNRNSQYSLWYLSGFYYGPASWDSNIS